MPSEILRLGAGDFGELVPFLARAFGREETDWFSANLPALYQPTEERMRCNLALREGGRLAAVAGVFPFAWRVGGASLRVAGIGGVATDPGLRGKGHMRRLMDRALVEVRAGGFHLSYLGGQRQRYLHWGWERAGVELHALVGPANVRRHFGGEGPGVELSPLGDEPSALAAMRAIHDAQPSRCERPGETFALSLRMWGARPLVARAGGRPVGYAVVSNKGDLVPEVVGADLASALGIVRALAAEGNARTFVLSPGALARAVGEFAEVVSLHPSGNWQVLDWPAVLGALMRARAAEGPMAEGEVVVGLRGGGGRFALRVGARGVSCEPSDRPAALELDGPGLLRCLAGPLSPSRGFALPPAAAPLDAWCPLPLYLARQDHV